MDRDQLFASLAQAPPGAEDVIYVERRGSEYAWQLVENGLVPTQLSAGAHVWMYFTGAWPHGDAVRTRAFCQNMLAEMESMAGGANRCRWPLDQPWPHLH